MYFGVSVGNLYFSHVGFHLVNENGVTSLVMDSPEAFPDVCVHSRAMGRVVFPLFRTMENPLAVAMVDQSRKIFDEGDIIQHGRELRSKNILDPAAQWST